MSAEREGLREALAKLIHSRCVRWTPDDPPCAECYADADRYIAWGLDSELESDALLPQAQEPVCTRCATEDALPLVCSNSWCNEPAQWYEPVGASPVASAPCREDEAQAAGAMGATHDAHQHLADVVGRMKALGYDARTLEVLTDHLFGGEEVPEPTPDARYVVVGKDRDGQEWLGGGTFWGDYDKALNLARKLTEEGVDLGYTYSVLPVGPVPADHACDGITFCETCGAEPGEREPVGRAPESEEGGDETR